MKNKKNTRLTLLISAGAIVVITLVGVVVALFLDKSPSLAQIWAGYNIEIDPNCEDGPLAMAGQNSESEPPGEGTVRYRMNQTPWFFDTDKKGTVYFESDEQNKYFLTISYVLPEDEVVYSSGMIPPGSHINTAHLQKKLEKGEHEAICRIELFDMDSLKSAGMIEEEIVIVIER